VLRRACRDAALWPAEVGVAVNISALQLGDDDLVGVVGSALRDSGLAAERLELEITESSLLHDGERTLAILHRIKALGVRIAMDDFGAGHSSLGYLQRFPFDKVKIDRAFAKSVDRSEKNAAIVKAILDLCAALGLATTIEGVETEEQFQALARMGSRKVQGYLFSPPQPAERVPDMLARFGERAPPRCAAE
jgi:EAL domain-containing protein (putative c-di-GMP-specific phosphodiesterase class I)